MAEIATHGEAGVTLRFGFVSDIDEQAHRVRVWLPDLQLKTWWLAPLLAGSRGDRHYQLPDLDEHVAVLLDARGEAGVVLGSLYSARDAAPVTGGADRHHVCYKDGTTIDYDRRTHRLTVHCVGDIEIVSDTHIVLRAPRIDLN